LTQEELASRLGTFAYNVVAYEHGRIADEWYFARLLSEAGASWRHSRIVTFVQRPAARGRSTWVPDRLPRLDAARALP